MKKAWRITRRVLIAVISIIMVCAIIVYTYMLQPKFGESPSGERLERIRQSPHFKNDGFQNLENTPILAEGHSLVGELWKTLTTSYPRQHPVDPVPAVKSDLLHLPRDSNLLVWFGHSSCFIQLNGKRILVDPVFSANASPIPGTLKPFAGTAIYHVRDLPAIDYLLISHDHYDHLDYNTVRSLRHKTKFVVCGLGLGADFEYWGYAKEQIIEKDWDDSLKIDSGFTIFTETTRHQSGRNFKRDKSLWMSYILQSPDFKVFLSGDGGYGKHFAEMGRKYGPIDLAIIENGQYDSAWHNIHLLPNETLQAAKDLRAKRLLPIHNSKFMLARHAWNAPMSTLSALVDSTMPLLTPRIGEIVHLNDPSQKFTQWWRGVK